MGGVLVLLTVTAIGTQIGWVPNRSGDGVEYIVQISPDRMEDFHRVGEVSSQIPSEVAGHITKVVVRVGTDPVPREMPRGISLKPAGTIGAGSACESAVQAQPTGGSVLAAPANRPHDGRPHYGRPHYGIVQSQDSRDQQAVEIPTMAGPQARSASGDTTSKTMLKPDPQSSGSFSSNLIDSAKRFAADATGRRGGPSTSGAGQQSVTRNAVPPPSLSMDASESSMVGARNGGPATRPGVAGPPTINRDWYGGNSAAKSAAPNNANARSPASPPGFAMPDTATALPNNRRDTASAASRGNAFGFAEPPAGMDINRSSSSTERSREMIQWMQRNGWTERDLAQWQSNGGLMLQGLPAKRFTDGEFAINHKGQKTNPPPSLMASEQTPPPSSRSAQPNVAGSPTSADRFANNDLDPSSPFRQTDTRLPGQSNFGGDTKSRGNQAPPSLGWPESREQTSSDARTDSSASGSGRNTPDTPMFRDDRYANDGRFDLRQPRTTESGVGSAFGRSDSLDRNAAANRDRSSDDPTLRRGDSRLIDDRRPYNGQAEREYQARLAELERQDRLREEQRRLDELALARQRLLQDERDRARSSSRFDDTAGRNLGASSASDRPIAGTRPPSEDKNTDGRTRKVVAAQPLFNFLMLISIVGNIYLFMWLKGLRQRYHEMVAAKRISQNTIAS